MVTIFFYFILAYDNSSLQPASTNTLKFNIGGWFLYLKKKNEDTETESLRSYFIKILIN